MGGETSSPSEVERSEKGKIMLSQSRQVHVNSRIVVSVSLICHLAALVDIVWSLRL